MFEQRYLKRTTGHGIKEVLLTEGQIFDLYKDKDVTAAIVQHCKNFPKRMKKHPQAPNCPRALRFLVEVEAAKWENLEEVMKKGVSWSADADQETAAAADRSMTRELGESPPR